MIKFQDLKLVTKQIIGFGAILVILAIVNIFAITRIARLNSDIDEVSKNWLPRAVALSDINYLTSQLRASQLAHLFAESEALKEQQKIAMSQLLFEIDHHQELYDSLKTESENKGLYSETERELYSAFEVKWDDYLDLSITFMDLISENKNHTAVDLITGESKSLYKLISADLTALVDLSENNSLKASERAELTYRATKNVFILLLFGAVALSVLIATAIIRSITGPVYQLQEAAAKVTEGNLDVQVTRAGKDEIGHLSDSFNHMTAALKEAMTKMEGQAERLRHQNEQLEQAMADLKQTQQQLLLKEKLASLGNLVAGIAHEINNPIGVVAASSDVSERCVRNIENAFRDIEKIKTEGNGTVLRNIDLLKNNLNVIYSASDRIINIVRSLKNFAHLDEAEYQKVDVHEGIDSSLTLLGTELLHGIKINKNYSDLPKIACYPAQLNQVFINLLKNAAESISRGGEITITTLERDGMVRIDIADTGRGIERERLNTLFDFGFSSDRSRVKMSSGLSSSYNIIQKHNGEMKVTSEVGKGTTCSILLPYK